MSEYDVVLISPHIDYDNDDKPFNPYDEIDKIIPLGIISIAQYLENKGFKVKLLHIPLEFNIKSNLSSVIQKYKSPLYLIQCHWYLYGGGAIKVAKICKKINPDSKIFLGGYHSNYFYMDILNKENSIDGIILGEGEVAAEKIVEIILKGRKIQNIPGTAIKIDGKIHYDQPTKDNIIPIEDIPIIDPKSKFFNGISIPEFFYINLVRGRCKYHCGYCVANNPNFNVRNFEYIPIKKIVEQLTIYNERNIKEVFMGETEFQDKIFINDIAEAIQKENINLSFRLETNPSLFTKDITRKLVKSGFYRFTVGCETGSDELLTRIGRSSSKYEIITATKNIVENSALLVTSWIANLPTERNGDFLKTLETMYKVANIGGYIYWVENLHVLPGSRFYEKYSEFSIKPILTTFDEWIHWAPISKTLVNFDEMEKDPMKYITHIDEKIPPKIMILRFKAMRLLALDNIDNHIIKLETNEHIPKFIKQTEMKNLENYKKEQYKLLLF
jgi:radical SAM superfamily enzyme YgiQ (UPF0313 family)